MVPRALPSWMLGRGHQIFVDLRLEFLIQAKAFVQAFIIGEQLGLGFHHAYKVDLCMSDAFFVFDVIIHRGIHRAEAVSIADVFQIEQEILAPVQFLPAQHAVVPDERRRARTAS